MSITNVTRSGADLTWSDAAGAAAYWYGVDYLVAGRWIGNGNWAESATVDSPVKVRLQREGATQVQVGVIARNNCGQTFALGSCFGGRPELGCKKVDLIGPPVAPTGVVASYSNGQLRIDWAVPQDNGGSVVSNYEVIASPGGVVCQAATTYCFATVAAQPGTQVTFQVKAANSAGAGELSGPSSPVTIIGTPSPPRQVRTTSVAQSEVTVAWSAPESTGGVPLRRYVVTARPGGKTCESTGSSCRISGLQPGSRVRFAVVADNGVLLSSAALTAPVLLPKPSTPRPIPKPTPKPTQPLN